MLETFPAVRKVHFGRVNILAVYDFEAHYHNREKSLYHRRVVLWPHLSTQHLFDGFS